MCVGCNWNCASGECAVAATLKLSTLPSSTPHPTPAAHLATSKARMAAT